MLNKITCSISKRALAFLLAITLATGSSTFGSDWVAEVSSQDNHLKSTTAGKVYESGVRRLIEETTYSSKNAIEMRGSGVSVSAGGLTNLVVTSAHDDATGRPYRETLAADSDYGPVYIRFEPPIRNYAYVNYVIQFAGTKWKIDKDFVEALNKDYPKDLDAIDNILGSTRQDILKKKYPESLDRIILFEIFASPLISSGEQLFRLESKEGLVYYFGFTRQDKELDVQGVLFNQITGKWLSNFHIGVKASAPNPLGTTVDLLLRMHPQ